MAIDNYKSTTGLAGEGFRNYMKANTKMKAFNSSKVYEQNLNSMNGLLLKTMQSGYDALTLSEKENVDVLAHSCLNQKGTAVLRARTIWSYFNPTEVFDDRLICFNASNKNFKGDYDAYLTDQSGISNILNSDLEVLVYPNPTNNEVNISTTNETAGVFSLYDLLGQRVFSVSFNQESKVHTLTLPKAIQNGLFTYQYCTNSDCTTGKVSVLR